MTDTRAGSPSATAEKPFEITFPKGREEDRDQDEEFCEVALDGETRRIRFHDYHELYAIPGLYEQLFYEKLKCDSPRTIATLLDEQLDDDAAADLRVLDVGAGNGMVGEELDRMGAEHIVGVDIIEEAAEAAQRDRPGVYDDYFVVDLTDVPPDTQRELAGHGFNCLTTVAALGFGDIPPEAFTGAYNLVEDGGLIAFNIKQRFVEDGDRSGFEELISRSLDDGTMELQAERRYRHRLSVAGDPLYYIAMVARKRADIAA
ncbi:MAG: methyltransferase domain-containing protein [Thermoleophilaceae bacterium]